MVSGMQQLVVVAAQSEGREVETGREEHSACWRAHLWLAYSLYPPELGLRVWVLWLAYLQCLVGRRVRRLCPVGDMVSSFMTLGHSSRKTDNRSRSFAFERFLVVHCGHPFHSASGAKHDSTSVERTGILGTTGSLDALENEVFVQVIFTSGLDGQMGPLEECGDLAALGVKEAFATLRHSFACPIDLHQLGQLRFGLYDFEQSELNAAVSNRIDDKGSAAAGRGEGDVSAYENSSGKSSRLPSPEPERESTLVGGKLNTALCMISQ